MDDKQQIEIEFVYTRELFQEAYRNIYRDKVKPQNFIWLFVAVAGFFVYNVVTRGLQSDDIWYYLPLLGIPVGLLLAVRYLPQRLANKTIERSGALKIKWVISRQNIQITTDKTNATVEWSYFEKATISKNIILLVTTSNKALTPVPIAAFKNDDFEVFKTWLKQNVTG